MRFAVLFVVLFIGLVDFALGGNESGNDKPTCHGFPCPPGQRCFLEKSNCRCPPCPIRPICKPTCKGFECPCGQECYLKTNPCLIPPCPTEPACRDKAPTCKGFPCPDGERCQLVDVVCKRAPCPPQPTCTPDDLKG